MIDTYTVISPVDGSVYTEYQCTSMQHIAQSISETSRAQAIWEKISIEDRKIKIRNFITYLDVQGESLAKEVAILTGKPYTQSLSEIQMAIHSIRYSLDICDNIIGTTYFREQNKVNKCFTKEPIGKVLIISHWNCPYFSPLGAIIPALLAGNSVLLAPSKQTIQCGKRIEDLLIQTGIPHGLIKNLIISEEDLLSLIKIGTVDAVQFFGTSIFGNKVIKAANSQLIKLNLAMSGKDSAYVSEDANLDVAVASLAKSSFENSGQYFHSLERIYVQENNYLAFIELFQKLVRKMHLGNPLNQFTTLGPMAIHSEIIRYQKQLNQAVQSGAKTIIEPKYFRPQQINEYYVAPQIIINAQQESALMQEPIMGPAVTITPVKSDQQAIELINDCQYALASSIWTGNNARAEVIANEIRCGICYINTAVNIDPQLPYSGRNLSSFGTMYSHFGFTELLQTKAYIAASE